MILDLDMIGQTMLLEKQKINNLGVGKYFLNRIHKALTLKESTDILDYIKIKNSCSSKDIIKIIKKQDTEWEKIIAITTKIHSILKYIKTSYKSIRK